MLLIEIMNNAGWVSPEGDIYIGTDHWSVATDILPDATIEELRSEPQLERWELMYSEMKDMRYVDFIIEKNRLRVRSKWMLMTREQRDALAKLSREKNIEIRELDTV